MPSHRETIVDQFSKQAIPFATAPAIRDHETLQLIVDFAGATTDDLVLDVACGPGLVVCAFAPRVRHATGIDLTPAMIEQAKALQHERALTNVSWRQGDVCPLPYPDASFSLVVSRYAFHHFPDPAAVLVEMVRVCRPGGRVMVVDLLASADARKADALNRMERLRDPSHARALPPEELAGLFAGAGLPAPRSTSYRLELELEAVLERSFPNPGDAEEVRRLFVDSIPDDGLGLGVHRRGDRIRFAYPVAVLVAFVGA